MKKFGKIGQKLVAIFFVLQIIFPGWVHASSEILSEGEKNFVEGEIIVKYRDGHIDEVKKTDATLETLVKNSNETIRESVEKADIMVVKQESSWVESIFETINGVDREATIADFIHEYEQDPNVEFAQPNFLYKLTNSPNDEYYTRQWYLENRGQPITGQENYYNELLAPLEEKYGKTFRDSFSQRIIGMENGVISAKENVDIDYERALQIYKTAKERQNEAQKNEKVLVAVIDSGVDYTKSEFSGKMWDGSQCVTYTGAAIEGWCRHGYNFGDEIADGMMAVTQSGGVYHGTQVASIIAATGNNAVGMTGVAPDVEIMSIGVEDSNGAISTLSVIQGIFFAERNGAEIINLSIGSINPIDISETGLIDKLFYSSIDSFSGIIVNSAGNESTNIDDNTSVMYPASFGRDLEIDNESFPALENLVVVGAHTAFDKISFFSNHGPASVDISAPGSDLLVLGRWNDSMNSDLAGTEYDYNNGTSFSAPIVTGAFAMLKSAYPEKNLSEIRDIIFSTADKKAEFATKVRHGNSLNLASTMEYLESQYMASVPLSGSISANETTWTKNPITLTLEASENIIKPENWEKISDKKFSRIVNANVEISENISTETGKSAIVTFAVKNIDTMAPTVAIENIPSKITQWTQKIAFSATDNASGVKNFECFANDTHLPNCNSPYNFSLREGNNSFQVIAIDNAMNVSEKKTITIEYEKSTDSTPAPTPVASSSNSTVSSGGGSGGYVPSISESPSKQIDVKTAEENIIHSSAPEEENHKFMPKVTDSDLFEYDRNIEYSADDVEKILAKEWIREWKEGKIRRFSVADKIFFLESVLGSNAIEDRGLGFKAVETSKIMIEEIKKIQNTFLENFKKWKFFILDITK